LIVATVVAVVCWSVPFVQQLTHHPGNLAVLAREATTHQPAQGARTGWRVLERTVGVPPRWLRAPSARGGRFSDTAGGDYGDTRLRDLSTVPGKFERATTVAILIALVLAAVGAWRRRRGD